MSAKRVPAAARPPHFPSSSSPGLNTSLVPMYISEIAPLNLRGGLGTVNQLAVTVGLLLSQVLGIEQILGTNDGWPVLLGLAICPAILQLLLLPICPESPRYLLITKQWEEEARKGKYSISLSVHQSASESVRLFLRLWYGCFSLFLSFLCFALFCCSSAPAQGFEPGGGGHRGDAGRRAGPAVREQHIDDRAHLLADAPGTADNRNCDAA